MSTTQKDHVGNNSEIAQCRDAEGVAGPDRNWSSSAAPETDLQQEATSKLDDSRKIRAVGSSIADVFESLRADIDSQQGEPPGRDLLYQFHLERAFTLHRNLTDAWSWDPESIKCREALSELDQAIQLVPENPEAHWWRLYFLRPKVGQATNEQELEKISRLGVDNGAFHALHASWLRYCGGNEAAFEKASRAVESSPNLCQSWLQRGRAAEELGRADEAASDYKEYLVRCGRCWELDLAYRGFPTSDFYNTTPLCCNVHLVAAVYGDRECTIGCFECSRRGQMNVMTFAYHIAESQLLREAAMTLIDEDCIKVYECFDTNKQLVDCLDYRIDDLADHEKESVGTA